MKVGLPSAIQKTPPGRNAPVRDADSGLITNPVSVWFWTVLFVGICVLPLVLMAFGVDFSNGHHALSPQAADQLTPEELGEAAFRVLSGSFTHTILEWSALSVSFFVAVLVFLQYRLTRESSLPVIGIAMACAGAMDGFHIFTADRLIDTVADDNNILPLTWAISRMFNAVILTFGVGLFALSRSRTHGQKNGRAIRCGIAICVVAVLAVMYACVTSPRLPRTMFPEGMIKRPYDVYPLLPYLVCGLYMFPRYLKSHRTLFAYALLLSIIPQIATQLYMIFGSSHLHDSCFNVAHALKVFSYVVPMGGLLAETTRTFRERERAELGNRKLSAIVESSDDAIVGNDLEGVITSWNAGAQKLYGYTAEDVVGHNIDLLFPFEIEGENAPLISQLPGGRIVHRIETVGKRKLGSLVDVALTISPIYDSDGQVVGISRIARDITEKKKAEAQLRESEERMRVILETAADGIVTTNSRGIIITFNQAAERIFGYADDEAIGKDLSILMPPPHGEKRDEYFAGYLRTGEAKIIGRSREVEGLRKDGATFPLSLAVSEMVLDGDLYFTGIVQDITARKEAERAMQALNLSLEQINAELESKNAEMEQFVYTVSHDLKSPLVTIQGFMTHLCREAKAGRTDRLEDFSTRIQSATSRMKTLIEDLLDLSRVGRAMAEPQPVALGDLVGNIVDRHHVEWSEQNIEVSVEDNLPTLNGDPERIIQVFDNLLTNAAKYGCQADGGRITIGTLADDQGVRLFVKDDGPGIPVEYQDRIFQLFQRLQSDKEGTGIGLAIVKRIVEVHDGRIWVESTPGQGAAFWMAFPPSRVLESTIAYAHGGA